MESEGERRHVTSGYGAQESKRGVALPVHVHQPANHGIQEDHEYTAQGVEEEEQSLPSMRPLREV